MLKLKSIFFILSLLFSTAIFSVNANASTTAKPIDITGAGASLPFPIYAKWAAKYHKETGHRINFQSIGSGGGQQQIIAKTVNFGASDDPMRASKLEQHGLLQFPAVIGGTVPVINVAGIKPGDMRLTGELLASIFLGDIKKWNDPAIKSLNPGLQLPDTEIVVVHRSDGSGTTFGWTNYLSKVSSSWKQRVGEGKAVKWPTGQGGKGNEGVSAYVRQLHNTIGYIEFAYAQQNNLVWVQLQNKEGNFIKPSQESFALAAENADWLGTPGMGVVLNNMPGENAWPIVSATFILVHKLSTRPVKARAVLEFFKWAYENGGKMASELGYVPLPPSVHKVIYERWAETIKTTDGSFVWTNQE